jgi:hypothetical protein
MHDCDLEVLTPATIGTSTENKAKNVICLFALPSLLIFEQSIFSNKSKKEKSKFDWI